MENPMLQREEGEGEGEVVDLKTRRRFQQNPKAALSPTLSEISTESSEISFEYFQNNNGEKASTSEVEEEKEETFEVPIKEHCQIMMGSNGVVSNEGTNGISVHQNGLTAAYSHSGYQEITATDKSPDGGVGLKDFGSMFDESFKNDSIAATDVYNSVEDILKNASMSGEGGNVNFDKPKDNPLPVVEEIDVENEIQKQVFTLKHVSNSVENESVVLDLRKDNPFSKVEEFDVERKIPKQVFNLNDVSNKVENGSVSFDLPKDNHFSEVEKIDVERKIQKEVFTLNDVSNNVENGSVNLDLPKHNSFSEIEEIEVEREIKKHVFTLNNVPQSVENETVDNVEEFDVERVIQKQETHDFYCPNCNSCITKRVVLRRRKRKIQDISASEDAGSSIVSRTEVIVQGAGEIEPPLVDETLEEPVYAMTCLSCFSIFLPSRNGWLGRIFGRKPDVPAQPADSLTESLLSPHGGNDGEEAMVDAELDDRQGHVFPLWIVNCCQPSSDRKRPLTPGITVQREPEIEPAQEHPEHQFEGNGDLRPTEHGTEPTLAPPEGAEGSKEEIKQYMPGDSDSLIDAETKLPSVIEPRQKPGKYGLQVIAPEPPKQHLPNGEQISPDIERDSDNTFALWFVNCCQPNKDGSRLKLLDKLDTSLPPKPEPTPGIELPRDSEAVTTPVAGTPVSLKLEPIPEPELPLSSEPISHIILVRGGELQLPHEFKPHAESNEGTQPSLFLSQGGESPHDFKSHAAPNEGTYPSLFLSEGGELTHEFKSHASQNEGTYSSVFFSQDGELPHEFKSHAAQNEGTYSSVFFSQGAEIPHEFKPHATQNEETYPSFFLSQGTRMPPTAELILDPSKPFPGMGTPLAEEPVPLPTPHDDVDARVPSKPTSSPKPGAGTPLEGHKPMPRPAPTPGGEGGDPIITISGEVTRRPHPVAPIPDDIPHEAGPLSGVDNPLLEQGLRRPQGGPGIDIIKAIVYGGLVESITSLSVIASAAGGDATTLNIVALGMANMFGGLILLFHNLRTLKHEHVTEHYIQELGRPGHFLLHATVAIISYIIFGLMAPVIYGFSFRKSDNKNFKLATLAAASFVSIMVLSSAKAYVRNPPKAYIKTVFYYLCIGLMVSGLGYVAGDLINELLKKLGVLDPKSVVPQGGDVQGLWASY